jgi:hypothetical protein
MKKCEACGTTKNIYGSLGGVMLCKEHYADISAQVEAIRAVGSQVNVMGIARQMFREQFSTGDYVLRDIPKELWDRAKQKAFKDGISLRELILTAIQEYLDKTAE